jgi:hypothetical protein
VVFVCYISALFVTDPLGCKHCMGGVLVFVHPGTGVHMGRCNISSLFRDRKWLMSSTAFERGASVGWEGVPGRDREVGKYINSRRYP